jgi:hypothetical protein
MTFLLDVNVLFILHQPRHADYRPVYRWFKSRSADQFATCPMTQAGLLRLLTQGIEGLDRFPMDEARDALHSFVQHSGHVFWPDAPPYLDITAPLSKGMQGHRQVTDAYLLGLVIHHRGKLATLDRGILHMAGKEFAASVEIVE